MRRVLYTNAAFVRFLICMMGNCGCVRLRIARGFVRLFLLLVFVGVGMEWCQGHNLR